MRIVISGIPIDIQKKNIKNMHLQIKPPDGHVVISTPLSMMIRQSRCMLEPISVG